MSFSEFLSLREAWENRIKRERLTAGHMFASLMNMIGGLLLGDKFTSIYAKDIWPEIEEEIIEEAPKEVLSSGSAELLAYFTTNRIQYAQKMIEEARLRQEKYGG